MGNFSAYQSDTLPLPPPILSIGGSFPSDFLSPLSPEVSGSSVEDSEELAAKYVHVKGDLKREKCINEKLQTTVVDLENRLKEMRLNSVLENVKLESELKSMEIKLKVVENEKKIMQEKVDVSALAVEEKEYRIIELRTIVQKLREAEKKRKVQIKQLKQMSNMVAKGTHRGKPRKIETNFDDLKKLKNKTTKTNQTSNAEKKKKAAEYYYINHQKLRSDNATKRTHRKNSSFIKNQKKIVAGIKNLFSKTNPETIPQIENNYCGQSISGPSQFAHEVHIGTDVSDEMNVAMVKKVVDGMKGKREYRRILRNGKKSLKKVKKVKNAKKAEKRADGRDWEEMTKKFQRHTISLVRAPLSAGKRDTVSDFKKVKKTQRSANKRGVERVPVPPPVKEFVKMMAEKKKAVQRNTIRRAPRRAPPVKKEVKKKEVGEMLQSQYHLLKRHVNQRRKMMRPPRESFNTE